MKHIEIVNCFINGAAHTHYAERHCPLVDEDLSMAFDAAEAYADMSPMATIEQAHAAGHEYMTDSTLPISSQEEAERTAYKEVYRNNMASFIQSALEVANDEGTQLSVATIMQLIEAGHRAAEREANKQTGGAFDNPEAMFSEGQEWIIPFLD